MYSHSQQDRCLRGCRNLSITGQRLQFLVLACFYYYGDYVNFPKSVRFGFADVTQNVDMRSSENLRLQQSIEAVVYDPTKTPPRPTGWEPLVGTVLSRFDRFLIGPRAKGGPAPKGPRSPSTYQNKLTPFYRSCFCIVPAPGPVFFKSL